MNTDNMIISHREVALHNLLFTEDADAPKPAVLVCHAWGGRGEFEIAQAKRLAALGYVGIAADLYGEGRLGQSKEENQALMQPLVSDRAMLQGRLQTLLQAVKARPEVDEQRVVVMGYCFGGLCALDLARTGAIFSGAVSFHGILKPPGNTQGQDIAAKVLVLHGYADPMAPPEDVTALATELTQAGADWQLHAYGNAMHAFTFPEANDPDFGTVYSESTDQRSWQALENFLVETF